MLLIYGMNKFIAINTHIMHTIVKWLLRLVDIEKFIEAKFN